MSRLSELIAELCPDGVEYKRVDQVVSIRNGSDHKHLGNGNIPVYGSGGVMRFVDTASYQGPSVLLPRKGSVDKVYFVDEPFWNVDTIFYTVIDESQVVPKFFYYLMVNAHLEQYSTSAARPSLTQRVLNRIVIPVPPIEVQREVVRILDEYTAAHDELVMQLEQEIELRKQSDALSYQRYLDEWIGATSETMMLKELVLPGRKISYGIVQPGEGGTGDLGVIRPIDIKNSHINVGGIKYVDRSKEDGYQRTKLQGGEILVVVRGTTGEIAVAPDECKGMNVTRGIAVIATNDSVVDRDYLFDFLRGESAQRYIANNTRGTALRQINISDLEKLKIPVLRDSLREGFAGARSKAQTMTDAHYGLIHELSTGISLENQLLSQIRNQLLSFPEKVA